MKRPEKLLLGVELATIAFAVLLPLDFVSQTAAILDALFGAHPASSAYAYGVVLILVCAASSRCRKINSAAGTASRSRPATIFNALTVLGASLMVYSIVTPNVSPVDARAVVSTYFSYLISVFFCFGVGHALADLLALIRSGPPDL
jgi:hypothetical protein